MTWPTPVPRYCCLTTLEDLEKKVTEVKSTIKFQLKKVLCLGVAIGHVQMTDEELLANVMLAINFLISLLKKGEHRTIPFLGRHRSAVCTCKLTIPPPFPLAFPLHLSQAGRTSSRST